MRFALLVALLALAVTAAPASAKVGDVPKNKSLLVIGQSGIDKVDAVRNATGLEPSGGMWYVGLYEDVGPVVDQMTAAVTSHRGLVLNLGLSFGAISTPSPSYGPLIAAGHYDDTIRELARGIKAIPTVAYIRPGYEFDLLGGQYGPPEVYKAAYRRVVDVFREEGVRNVAWVWHSAGAFWRATDPSVFAHQSGSLARELSDLPVYADPQPISAWFPGSQYVDAFGISYWQDSCCFGRSEAQARDVYEERTREILDQAKELQLPLHISESTPVYVGADSGAKSIEWLDNTFELIHDYDIKSWSLISIDWQADGGFFSQPFWNGYWPDSAIHEEEPTRNRFSAEAASGRYLLRTQGLPHRLGYPNALPKRHRKR